MVFRVCSYNIHKGLSAFNLRPILEPLKKFLTETHADVLCLQEVVGTHRLFKAKFGEKFAERQFEYLADSVWNEHAYGKNAVYSSGDHGNAILSHFPISAHTNHNISVGKRERRGLLHTSLQFDESRIIHCYSTHLNLTGRDRRKQISAIAQIIRDDVPDDTPIILCGDFNDWREELGAQIEKELGLSDARASKPASKFKTFPARAPVFALDRIYYRNLEITDIQVIRPPDARLSSDHLPILADFRF